MKCPKCGSDNCCVIDTRSVDVTEEAQQSKDENYMHIQQVVRRRYKCKECEERFTTYESTINVRNLLVPVETQQVTHGNVQPQKHKARIKCPPSKVDIEDIYRIVAKKYKSVSAFAEEQSKLGNIERALEQMYIAQGIKTALYTIDKWMMSKNRLEKDETF